jgi:thiamine kinase-like enzyme
VVFSCRKAVEAARSPVIFGHNDMQEGNILVERNDNGEISRLVIIDFEYCSYNYRGFDLANHFCEWMYNYKVDTPPFFTAIEENYPNEVSRVQYKYNIFLVLWIRR